MMMYETRKQNQSSAPSKYEHDEHASRGRQRSLTWALALALTVTGGAAAFAGPKTPEPEVGQMAFSLSAQRDRVEDALAQLEDSFSAAQERKDLSYLLCVKEQHKRGVEVFSLAKAEMAAAQDPAATPRAQALSLRKLSATADQLDAANEQVAGCRSALAPNLDPGGGRTQQEIDSEVPLSDPTVQSGVVTVPPSVTPLQLLIASPSI